MKEVLTNPDAWSAIAGEYDRGARRRLTPFSAEAVRWAELDDTDDVLDVACGPGTTTMLAAPKARSVQAVDFASEMIAKLRENTAELPNVSSMVGNGQELSFEDERFSVAFSMFGLMFFPDPIAGLRELHRVLEPGGRVFISSWVPLTRSPMMQPLMAAMKHALPPEPGQSPPEPFAFADAESLAAGLRGGGFEDIEVQEFTPIIPIASADEYWGETRGNIFMNQLRQETGAKWPEIESRIVAHLAQSLHGVESLAMPGLIARGRKAGRRSP